VAASRLRTVLSVTGIVLISKLAGLFREIIIANRFGTSSSYDLYLIAIMLPALAYGVISFASFYLFVPALTRKFEQLGENIQHESWRFAWSLFNMNMLGALGEVSRRRISRL
jgi:putative peptidoglycan lipid II flippase